MTVVERPVFASRVAIRGVIAWEWRDARTGLIKLDADGNPMVGKVPNLITAIGDQMYAERGAGIGTIAAPTGMQLGTSTTATAKTGGGAAIGTYVAGSSKAFDGGYPVSAANGSARRITYRRTFAAGEATTASNIAEVVIHNQSVATDSAAAAANTISRGLITPAPKGASDILTITWTHDLLGA